jgi:hypothetical protein
LLGLFLDRPQFFRSYLVAYLLWLGVALGCLVILFLHHIAGGRWGFAIRRLLEAGAKTIPLMALLFVPLLFDLKGLYLWARPEIVAQDKLLQHKSLYLNVPAFAGRAIFYFAVWIILAGLANKWGDQQDEKRDASFAGRLRALGGAGLVLHGLMVTFASIDWVMSLDPYWYSTIYGLQFATGQVLSCLAVVILFAAWLHQFEPLRSAIEPRQFHDYGNLTLTFVILWTYLSFAQFLIIWSANLRKEIPWYLNRTVGGWQAVALALIVLHFAVPFVLLLMRGIKQKAALLAAVAFGLFAMRYVDLFWIVAPTFSRTGIRIHWLDFATLFALGGIWVSAYAVFLKKRPLLPRYDARIQERPEENGAVERA